MSTACSCKAVIANLKGLQADKDDDGNADIHNMDATANTIPRP